MVILEKIAQHKWLIISLMAAVGLGTFLYLLPTPAKQTVLETRQSTSSSSPATAAENNTTAQPAQNIAPADNASNQASNAVGQPAQTPDTNTQATPEKPVPADPATTQPADTAAGPDIINRLVTWGFSVPAKPRSIDTIIIHSNYNTLTSDLYSVAGAIRQFQMYDVSAHYLIDRAGDIFRLVPEKDIAFHAGVSTMPDGRTDVNNFSIGIEIITKDKNDAPTTAQYSAVKRLIADIQTRYAIKNVLGHSQIAPGRKTDPWNFDWSQIK
jgi:hypothetical protein